MATNAELVADLEEIKALIDTPQKWCQHTYAKSDEGLEVGWMEPEATCFCLTGALSRVIASKYANIDDGAEHISATARVLQDTIRSMSWSSAKCSAGSVVGFNDKATHAEVMRLLDDAIAAYS